MRFTQALSISAGESMPSELEDVLTAKGPGKIPAWAYGVGLAAAYLLYEYIKGKGSPASTPTSGTSSTPPGTTTETTTTSGYADPWYPTWLSGESPPGITSNTEWRHLAEDWLVSKGYSPGRVADALDDYLNGEHQDRENRRLVDLAVDMWGSPPQGTTKDPTAGNMNFTPDTSALDTADTGASGSDEDVSGAGTSTASSRTRVRTVKEERRRKPRRRR